jgi:hypothetical protein
MRFVRVTWTARAVIAAGLGFSRARFASVGLDEKIWAWRKTS